ncbi:MAG TPA: GNAT family N-acetyltransferase [Thermotogaceae bacterium]|nr:GNAT family N-acetyltransferase [Thermotogaceae bacterium]
MYDKVLKLSECNLVSFINLVNEIFKDYVVPIKWDIMNFEYDVRENSLSLDDSFVFFKVDEPIGFILMGMRNDIARIDAMGVIKEARGTGLANYILEYAFEHLKWKNISKIILEVANSDKRAVRFYLKNGFKHFRYLRSFILSMKDSNGIVDSKPKYEFKRSDNKEIHELALEAKYLFERKPNWQREPITLLLAEDRYNNELIIEKGKVIGYVVWGSVSSEFSFIVDFSPTKRKKNSTDLLLNILRHIYNESKSENVQIMNVPEDDPIHIAAKNLGFSVFITQDEMERKIH